MAKSKKSNSPKPSSSDNPRPIGRGKLTDADPTRVVSIPVSMGTGDVAPSTEAKTEAAVKVIRSRKGFGKPNQSTTARDDPYYLAQQAKIKDLIARQQQGEEIAAANRAASGAANRRRKIVDLGTEPATPTTVNVANKELARVLRSNNSTKKQLRAKRMAQLGVDKGAEQGTPSSPSSTPSTAVSPPVESSSPIESSFSTESVKKRTRRPSSKELAASAAAKKVKEKKEDAAGELIKSSRASGLRQQDEVDTDEPGGESTQRLIPARRRPIIVSDKRRLTIAAKAALLGVDPVTVGPHSTDVTLFGDADPMLEETDSEYRKQLLKGLPANDPAKTQSSTLTSTEAEAAEMAQGIHDHVSGVLMKGPTRARPVARASSRRAGWARRGGQMVTVQDPADPTKTIQKWKSDPYARSIGVWRSPEERAILRARAAEASDKYTEERAAKEAAVIDAIPSTSPGETHTKQLSFMDLPPGPKGERFTPIASSSGGYHRFPARAAGPVLPRPNTSNPRAIANLAKQSGVSEADIERSMTPVYDPSFVSPSENVARRDANKASLDAEKLSQTAEKPDEQGEQGEEEQSPQQFAQRYAKSPDPWQMSIPLGMTLPQGQSWDDPNKNWYVEHHNAQIMRARQAGKPIPTPHPPNPARNAHFNAGHDSKHL